MLWLSLFVFFFLSSEIASDVYSTTKTEYQGDVESISSEQLKTVTNHENKISWLEPVSDKSDTRYTVRQSYESILINSVKPQSRNFPEKLFNNIYVFTEILKQNPSNISAAYTRFKRQNIMKYSHLRRKRSTQSRKFVDEDAGQPWMVALVALDVIVALFAFNAVVALFFLAS